MDKTNYNAPVDDVKSSMMFSASGEDKTLSEDALEELSDNKGEDD